MAKALYHQESGDLPVETIPDKFKDADGIESDSISLKFGARKIVTNAKEGTGFGQYSIVPEPEPEKKQTKDPAKDK